MTKECKKIQKQLIAFHQNELSKERSDEILKHLKKCSYCNNKSKDIKTICASINNIDFPKPNKAFWKNYTKEVMQKLPDISETSPLNRLLSSFTFKASISRVPRFAYSMTLVAIFFGIFSFNQYLQFSDMLNNMDMISNMDILQDMPLYQNMEEITDVN